MIEGIIGRPGSGKSYEGTRRALEAAESGRQVFANFGMPHPNVERITIEDLTNPHMPSGMVVIDEAHLWFPSRMSLRLPASLMQAMSQTRKAGQGGGWDLLWISQHESSVDRWLRDRTNWLWLCKAWKGLLGGSQTKYFTATCWEPQDFRKKGKHYARYMHRFSQRVADAYDTYETLEAAAHVSAAADAYKNGGTSGEGSSSRRGAGPRVRAVSESA